ncbi:biotin--[acetyl-CoA-carboxylase] ligase [Pedobacter sp. LMG 31464]|uniref:Biotin--[acetyl-CoA-carboxylase] ligase n=1 Tax=Pedobacter planticolens TaxID=2679964 RepID=A0A923IWL1_9SPHI|nr:biotin--[acetyl-CoA-carboxylase] ligase [Pedobacter planticolens]MBB2146294.1 biotin--[acetyl-CoA-carboxylase] ligase [Pedobacter planticolens]
MQNNTFSTLFVGQNRIKLLAVDSTNNFLKDLVSKSEPLPEGTVIMADDQFAGRGQQENTWHAEPGKNLTISILLKPKFLPLNQQFLLNMAISIAINKVLTGYVANGFSIKWPNDIYYFDKKLGGILIESSVIGNTIKTAVIGIGLNINQQEFAEELTKTATSLHQILQEDVNLEELLIEICSQIESLYLQLKAGNYTFLREAYVDKLYKLNKPAIYRQNGEIFEGIIRGVTDLGLLNVERNGEITHYNFKEIEFLNHI